MFLHIFCKTHATFWWPCWLAFVSFCSHDEKFILEDLGNSFDVQKQTERGNRSIARVRCCTFKRQTTFLMDGGSCLKDCVVSRDAKKINNLCVRDVRQKLRNYPHHTSPFAWAFLLFKLLFPSPSHPQELCVQLPPLCWKGRTVGPTATWILYQTWGWCLPGRQLEFPGRFFFLPSLFIWLATFLNRSDS